MWHGALKSEPEPSTFRLCWGAGGDERLRISCQLSLAGNIIAPTLACVKRLPVPYGAMTRQFGEKLKFLREQDGLIQAELARRLEVSRHFLNNLEAGRKAPSLEIALKVAKMFQVATDFLLLDQPKPLDIAKHGLIPGNAEKLVPFGEKLQELRRRQGITQSELAKELGMRSQSHISQLESNQNKPSLDLVVQISRILKVSTDYLLREDIGID